MSLPLSQILRIEHILIISLFRFHVTPCSPSSLPLPHNHLLPCHHPQSPPFLLLYAATLAFRSSGRQPSQMGPTDAQQSFPFTFSPLINSSMASPPLLTQSIFFLSNSIMHRGLPWLSPIASHASDHRHDELVMSFADTLFGFHENAHSSPDSDHSQYDIDHDEDDTLCTAKSNKAFWDQQHQLLQASLCRTGSFEAKIRQATKAALRELSVPGMKCTCRQVAVANGCRSCLQREICCRLLDLGYNCAICKSKWSSSSKIPSGEHTYLEVMDKSNTKREVRVVIELNFPGQFEMARANEEYNRLVSQLPQLYVGKVERLQVLVKILCSAAKQCMKEKKMHLGPWRKQKYMQAKWHGTCDRSTTARPLPSTGGYSARPQRRPKASLLTCDLLENIPDVHRTVVEVV